MEKVSALNTYLKSSLSLNKTKPLTKKQFYEEKCSFQRDSAKEDAAP